MQNKTYDMHIVIFTGGVAPSPADSVPYWNNAFGEHGKPSFVIAADSGLETCVRYMDFFKNEYDFTPNCILGDFDSLSDLKILKDFPKEIIKSFPKDKDFTDTELALQAAYQKAQSGKASFITLVGGSGGRVDHFLGIFSLMFFKFSPDAWLTENQVLYRLKKRKRYSVSGLKKDDVVAFVSDRLLGRDFFCRKKIFTNGLMWDSALFFKKGPTSICNRINPEFADQKKPVKIKVRWGKYILILPFSAKVLEY